VPGGGLEPNEESFQAAARELLEEAGVRGVLSRSLGQFENTERRHRTAVFVLIVTEELDEWYDSKSIGRKRKWFQIDEALSLLVCGFSYERTADSNDIPFSLTQADHKPVQVQYVKLLKNCKR
jgi:8-oxo-dGTP pyrophosphatase MutT (NUDIX family)